MQYGCDEFESDVVAYCIAFILTDNNMILSVRICSSQPGIKSYTLQRQIVYASTHILHPKLCGVVECFTTFAMNYHCNWLSDNYVLC